MSYALLEGAAYCLGIKRDDLDVVVDANPDRSWGVLVHDAVPGGAGHVARVFESLEEVLEGTLERVASCSCVGACALHSLMAECLS